MASLADGDSFRCRDGRRVRLLGVDAPENDQPAGPEAKAALARLLPRGTRVELEHDVQARDQYGRELAYVWIGPTMVNEAMLQQGMVMLLTYAPNVRYVERFRAAQAAARQSRAGLWARGDFACAPKAHRQGRC